jgi:hypothetical protein
MYPYSVEELAWAVAREREDEARKARPHVGENDDECDCDGGSSLPKP